MGKHLIKRFLMALLTIYLIITLSFLMVRFMPGDPLMHLVGEEEYYYLAEFNPEELERLAEKYGCSGTLFEQYRKYMYSILHLDFGIAYSNKQPVLTNMLSSMKWTLILSFPTLIFGGIIGCLLGVIAGWLWKGMKRVLKQDYLALPVTAAIATICHTILVMGSIYLLLAQQYAQAKNVAITAVFGLVMGTVTASGIPEAIIAAVLVTVIGKALLHLMARTKKR